jgi:predicted nucleic acid-binding protein
MAGKGIGNVKKTGEIKVTVVCNSSPLISLSSTGLLRLLKAIYGRIIVPDEVFHEVTEKGIGRPGEGEVRKADWIEVASVTNEDMLRRCREIVSSTDATVVALAKERDADLVIVDDRELREFAESEGLSITGTVGILLIAKERRLIQSVKVEMENLVKQGLRISTSVYQEVLTQAGE